jgi:amino acid transporter
MKKQPTHKLGQLAATAICGNDISSSCLYVSALAIIYSGAYAWVALLAVGAVLYLFRKIYGEVVGALPLNGGAYNALLNTTSKSMASLAAALTILSYMATAVISASEAMHYLEKLIHGLPVGIATMALLAVFMGLAILGIGESAKVAIGIFIFHLVTLTVLAFAAFIFLSQHGIGPLLANFQARPDMSVTKALFFGFSAAMLGISGFESSANFVEEQASGVFPKTLRNMWIVVSIFNPLMAFLALSMMPISSVEANQNALLSFMGENAGGAWLRTVVSLDATLVLSGAVLTSFVGVGGLVTRMSLDRILPQFFLKRNKRGSTYVVAIAFFLLGVSVLIITHGDLATLAGVYTISFLAVMILFGVGNILLKIKRAKLPRPERAPGIYIFVAILAIVVAMIGNAYMKPEYLLVFFQYFIPAVIVLAIMLRRVLLLRLALMLLRYISDPLRRTLVVGHKSIMSLIERISSQQFVFFTKGDDVAVLNKVMQYVSHNEHTNTIKIVTVLEKNKRASAGLRRDIEVLDRAYPDIHIDFIVLHGQFGPELIEELSAKWKIPSNFMFIGSPGDRFPYRIEELGGVRLIM